MRRKPLTFTLGVIAAALIVAGAALLLVQLALLTPLPRALVEDELGELFGRRVRLDSLDTGWFGPSHLTDLRILSYDHRHVALYVPATDAEHPWLLPMITGWDRDIQAFTATGVEVGRHITWLTLDRVDAYRSDDGRTLTLGVLGEAEGVVTITEADDDVVRVQIDLRAAENAQDPPFQTLSLNVEIADDQVGLLTVQTERLNLEPLIMAVSPSVGQMYGYVSGGVELTLPDGELAGASGSGEGTISESDFVDVPLFAGIYDLMNLKFVGGQREGQGRIKFRFVDGVLLIDEMDYRNRGAYIEVAGKLTNPFHGGDALVDAYALASLKPLPDQSVLKAVNNLLSLLQAQVSGVHVTGTLAEQNLQPVPLKSIGDNIGTLFNRPKPEEGS